MIQLYTKNRIYTYSELIMSKSGRDIQILKNHNVTEILFECNTPLVTGSFKITLDILSRCYNCSLPGDVESKDDVPENI